MLAFSFNTIQEENVFVDAYAVPEEERMDFGNTELPSHLGPEDSALNNFRINNPKYSLKSSQYSL